MVSNPSLKNKALAWVWKHFCKIIYLFQNDLFQDQYYRIYHRYLDYQVEKIKIVEIEQID